MSTLDATRAELGLLVLYLNKAEARDKICRAIQYGSKFLSNGQPGKAQNVDKTTSLARKVFRLFKVRLIFFFFQKHLPSSTSFCLFSCTQFIMEYPLCLKKTRSVICIIFFVSFPRNILKF
jgi:hypothetical protein